MNYLYYGDNLDVLQRYIKDETVDLIYLDPPFNSNQDYNVLFAEQDGSRSAAQIKAFEDTWHWDQGSARALEEIVEGGGTVSETMQGFRRILGNNDMLAYLAMMAPRLMELCRVLKPTGSIYLHCDPKASHYLKILMDAVFTPRHFSNEIVWKRTHAHGGAKRFGPVHDVILYYRNGDSSIWNPQYVEYSETYRENFFRFSDPDGKRYRLTILTGSGRRNGSSGKPWRGVNPTAIGRHWAVPGYVRCILPNPGVKTVQEALDQLDKIDRIIWPKKSNGTPAFKQYLNDMEGATIQDVWTDIPPISAQAAERLGYPTQKPEALLERIILSSSNKGDLVLDPFCGCGTAVAAGQKLGRQWIGIDITHLAITLIKHRLKSAFGDQVEYTVIGEPVSLPDAETLATEDPYQFQWWALGLVGARPVEQKKGSDKGIDGRLYFHDEPGGKTKQIIISVKSGKVASPHVRDLLGVMEREKAQIGVLITLQKATKDMKKEAVGAGFYDSAFHTKHPKIQILTIGQLLSGTRIDYPVGSLDMTLKKAPKFKGKVAEQLPLAAEGPPQIGDYEPLEE